MKKIWVRDGSFYRIAKVDDEDFERIDKYPWHVVKKRKKEYAATSKIYEAVYMHHFILPLKKELEVDHKNGNGLDNQKLNLRYATRSQQNHNMLPKEVVKGVFPYNSSGRWYSKIGIGDKEYIRLGSFNTRKEAAEAYNKAALQYFGEFANLNILENIFD